MSTMSETDLIEQARDDLGEQSESVLAACEAFYGHGFADAVGGDVESPTGHFFRVHRWIVVTDSQGFADLEAFDSEGEAVARFATLESMFSDWLADE